MKRYPLRSGEALAIAPGEIKRDADGFFLDFGTETPANESRGTVAIVHVRGALGQFKAWSGDSYEAIVERVKTALDPKPSAVVMRVSSPGGVVAGLNECVLQLRKLSQDADVDLIAYVDELAASAAYAICCGCREVYGPPSCIAGSVGVISTMVSQAKADEMLGIEFRLITSGARKADGHLHAPLTDAAEAAEKARNDELAKQFFAIASEARGLSPKRLASLEAAIYLGTDARKVGLLDDVISFDELVAHLDRTDTGIPPVVAPNAGNITDRRARLDKANKSGSSLTHGSYSTPEGDMSVRTANLIAKLAAETDAAKVGALLVEYQIAAKAGGDDDDTDDDTDDPDDSASAKHRARAAKQKAKAEATGHRAKASELKAKAAELEEKAKKCEEESSGAEEEEEEEAKLAAIAAGGSAAALAAAELAKITQGTRAEIAQMKADMAKREQAASIKEALADGRITPHEAKMLGGKSSTFAAEYIGTRAGMRVAATEDGHLISPPTNTDASSEESKEIDRRLAAMGVTDKDKAAALRAEMMASRRKVETNGIGAVLKGRDGDMPRMGRY